MAPRRMSQHHRNLLLQALRSRHFRLTKGTWDWLTRSGYRKVALLEAIEQHLADGWSLYVKIVPSGPPHYHGNLLLDADEFYLDLVIDSSGAATNHIAISVHEHNTGHSPLPREQHEHD